MWISVPLQPWPFLTHLLSVCRFLLPRTWAYQILDCYYKQYRYDEHRRHWLGSKLGHTRPPWNTGFDLGKSEPPDFVVVILIFAGDLKLLVKKLIGPTPTPWLQALIKMTFPFFRCPAFAVNFFSLVICRGFRWLFLDPKNSTLGTPFIIRDIFCFAFRRKVEPDCITIELIIVTYYLHQSKSTYRIIVDINHVEFTIERKVIFSSFNFGLPIWIQCFLEHLNKNWSYQDGSNRFKFGVRCFIDVLTTCKKLYLELFFRVGRGSCYSRSRGCCRVAADSRTIMRYIYSRKASMALLFIGRKKKEYYWFENKPNEVE